MSTGSDPFNAALGPLYEAELSAGRLRYRDQGQGTPVIFLAGLLLHSAFWRRVVPELREPVRAIVPDLPLGAHVLPMRPGADLSPTGLADLIAELLDVLELERAVVVANDTGGALAQLLATRHPERVEALALTPCDCFDNFLPPVFRYLQLMSHLPGGMWGLGQALRFSLVRRMPFAFGLLSKRRIDDVIFENYGAPLRRNRAVRRDLAKVLRGIRKHYTVDAAIELSNFHQPTLIAWPRENRLFPFKHAEMLAEIMPDTRLVTIEDSYTYVPEDQPKALARHIDSLIRTAGSRRKAKVRATSTPPA